MSSLQLPHVDTDLSLKSKAESLLQQQSAPRPRQVDWDQPTPEKQAAFNKAVAAYYDKPFWAEPLPLPPEVDFLADVQEDLKFVALLLAVRKVAHQRGVSIAAQLDAWNYGRGAQ